VVKTGWLPKELRTPHYAGPGSDGYKKPAAAAPTTTQAVAKAKQARADKAGEVKMKRAAAAKKSAKKTSKR
jgi:ParB family chromosome partitioning protein